MRCPGKNTLSYAALCVFSGLVAGSDAGLAQTANCNRAAEQPIVHVEIPGRPFEPIASSDGCWIFVTFTPASPGATSGLAVLRRAGGTVSVVRTIPLKSNATGAVLTHDGNMLIIAAGPMVAFVDAANARSGQGDPVMGYMDAGHPIGAIYANVTADDEVAFVAAENAGGIIVLDLARARRSGFDTTAIVGAIPTGRAPIAVTLSPDGRYLYTTSQAAQPEWNWPINCKPEGQDPATATPNHANGAILIVDVERARSDPKRSVVARIPAGCNPVRLVLSPDGGVAYVTARGENALLAFDTKKLLSDSAHALIARVPVGTAPVGVAVIDGGKKIVTTNSNRFGGDANDRQSLSVVDAARIGSGAAAVLGTIPAGAFPRELRLTADQRTLLVTNFNSRTLQLIDLARLPLQAAKH